jgi:hypothetical protein
MEDWKYLKKLQLTERSGIIKGLAIAALIILIVGAIFCAVKCCLSKNCCGCGDFEDEDDFLDEDDFEDEE